ncbi:hypothetical protein QC764_504857 [Podospora pseudoanserina]|uniref:Uncharacterized protein n=1 Tax=Podospora pseudoanserina TaxID=2609844 RepID=A0ABR0I564_9PEZI|nr:hypothetical protein QC764_504857 [Podospora pseudoanserina]
MLASLLVAAGFSASAVAAPSALYPQTKCMDVASKIQKAIRHGFPRFVTVDENRNCKPQYRLNRGECWDHMSPDNNCKAYCETSHGWYWGHPRVLGVRSWHNPCQRSDSCGISVSLGGPVGEATTVMIKDESSTGNSTTYKDGISWGDTWTVADTFNFGVTGTAGVGLSNIPLFDGVPIMGKAGVDMTSGYTHSDGQRFEQSRKRSVDWESNVKSSQSYGITRTRQRSLSYSTTGSWSKDVWANDYCGSWFAVPLLGMSCGRAAMGDLVKNSLNNHTRCNLDKFGSFDVCASYGFKHETVPDESRTRTVFVLRDCKRGFILPGEWQQHEFAYSTISSMPEYYRDHISRWGIRNLDEKPEDDEWVFQRQMDQKLHKFTKTIGVTDYNFKYCGEGEYCVQLKLTKDRCYDIPRGYVSMPDESPKSAHVVSATVMPGHCCVLFSRHQCLGQAQRLLPGDTKLEEVAYEGLAHSVVCNVSDYCRSQTDEGYGSASEDD